MVVGEQELNPLEPGPRGRVEAVEEAQILEHHTEIGGEFRHGGAPLFTGGATDGYCCRSTQSTQAGNAGPAGNGRMRE
jgi:hypothetical protein